MTLLKPSMLTYNQMIELLGGASGAPHLLVERQNSIYVAIQPSVNLLFNFSLIPDILLLQRKHIASSAQDGFTIN
jgi:hypothetical protein